MENTQVEVRESITHTFDINQVHGPKTPERDAPGNYHTKHHSFSYQETGHRHHVGGNNLATGTNVATHSNTPIDCEFLHMVRKQEMAWENAEAAVTSLERRLRVLERSGSLGKASPPNMIHDNPSAQFPPCHDVQAGCPLPTGPSRCIYVSPMYDDKRGSIMYRTQVVEDGGCGPRKSFAERIRDDEKDLEIRRLRLDMQRQDLETRKLKTELRKLRALEFEENRNIILDKYVDKVNTVRSSAHTLSRPWNYHEALHHVKADISSSLPTSEGSVENPNGHVRNLSVDRQGSSELRCGRPWRSNLGLHGSFKSMGETFAMRGRREHVRAPSAGSELERYVTSSDCSNNSSMVQHLVGSLLTTLQASVDNLSNHVKVHEPRDSDLSKIHSGAIDDELFILKKILSRLQDARHESGHECFNLETRNPQAEKEKLENLQETLDRMLNQLAQAEFKVIALESSCLDKEKRVEDLESQLHVVFKEREALMVEKYELTNVIREMQQEAVEQRHRNEELLSINEELLEFSQAEEDKLGSYQEWRDRLLLQVVQYEDNCTNFETLLQEKEKELDDLNRRLKAGQIGADSIIFEKFELLGKIQFMQTESEELRKRIDELVSINEELLVFAQSKEDQLAYMAKELERLQEEAITRGVAPITELELQEKASPGVKVMEEEIGSQRSVVEISGW